MSAGRFALEVSSLNLRSQGGYLHFYCPGHPLARKNGYVALQRHVMSVRLGRWIGAGEEVLFLNGDKTDIRPENLHLVTAAELRAHTLGEPAAPVFLSCTRCGATFEAPQSDADRRFCSASCAAQASRGFEVEPEELEKLVWEMPTTQVAALFGVSDKAIEKRCKKYGIRKPPRGYWAKVNAGSRVAPLADWDVERRVMASPDNPFPHEPIECRADLKNAREPAPRTPSLLAASQDSRAGAETGL